MYKLSILAGALAASFLTVGDVQAADLPLPTKAPPPPPPAFSWTGFYIGANGGGGWGHQSLSGTEATVFGPTTFSASSNASGPLFGGQIGFNYEFFPSHVVIGIEADGDWANIIGSGSRCSTFSAGLFTGIVSGCATAKDTLQDFGTVRGRLGYAWDRVLLYGTGGWAYGYSAGNGAVTCVSGIGAVCPGTAGVPFTGGVASFSNTLSGWTAGAGIEWAFLPNWTARVEYLHLEFDNVGTNFTTTVTTALGTGPITTHASSNNGIDIVRVGINYLFNFGSGPPARF